MSMKHPIIAVTGSSGAGTTTVRSLMLSNSASSLLMRSNC